jgi:hypothetical protein
LWKQRWPKVSAVASLELLTAPDRVVVTSVVDVTVLPEL